MIILVEIYFFIILFLWNLFLSCSGRLEIKLYSQSAISVRYFTIPKTSIILTGLPPYHVVTALEERITGTTSLELDFRLNKNKKVLKVFLRRF